MLEISRKSMSGDQGAKLRQGINRIAEDRHARRYRFDQSKPVSLVTGWHYKKIEHRNQGSCVFPVTGQTDFQVRALFLHAAHLRRQFFPFRAVTNDDNSDRFIPGNSPRQFRQNSEQQIVSFLPVKTPDRTDDLPAGLKPPLFFQLPELLSRSRRNAVGTIINHTD